MAAAIAASLVLSCCDQPAESHPASDDAPDATPLRIALVMMTAANPFFVEMERGARRAEAELGIELVVRTAAQEVALEQQIAIANALIHDDIDALVIAPADSVRLVRVLSQAAGAGTPVINIDNRLDPDLIAELGLGPVPIISADNRGGAYAAALMIAQQAAAPAQAIIIEGIRDAVNSVERFDGAFSAFEDSANVTVVGHDTGRWRIDDGYEVACALLDAHPDVSLIFAANDLMALGAIECIEDTRPADRVLVAGFDALDHALTAICEGAMAATVDQNAAQQGYLGVVYAVRAARGQQVPLETVVDVEIITQDTLGVDARC